MRRPAPQRSPLPAGLLTLLAAAAYTGIAIDLARQGPCAPPSSRAPWTATSRPASGAPKAAPGDGAWTNQIGSFKNTDTGDEVQLTYSWKNYFGEQWELVFNLPESALEAAINAHGLSAESRRQFYANHLPEPTTATSEVFAALRERRGPVHLANHGVVGPESYAAFRRQIDAVEIDYLKSRGFWRNSNGRLELHYGALVGGHSPSLKDFAALAVAEGAARKMTYFQLIHAMMAMVHYLDYEIPGTRDGPRYLGGLWPPLEVLARGRGDCDSKAVLLSAIVNHFPSTHCAIVTIPGHAFNGFVGWHKRLPQDFVINHRGVDLLLVDVTSLATFSMAGIVHEEDKQNLRERQPEVFLTQ